MSNEARLDARLVIGGLWGTAPVVATKHTGRAFSGVVTKRLPRDDGWRVGPSGDRNRIIIASDTSAVWTLALRLPGPLGLGAEGLRRRCRERMKGDTLAPGFDMPKWFWPAFCLASVDYEGNVWLSRYLCMTDALAAALGWPTGPGAPVYGWRRGDSPGFWLLSGGQFAGRPGTKNPTEYRVDESITDPMEALESAWRSECVR